VKNRQTSIVSANASHNERHERGEDTMARRLKTIAREINESIAGLRAKVVPGYCNTDRKAGRLRVPGKGRHGNRLIVTDVTGKTILDHNGAETYRSNDEVERWLTTYKRDHAPPRCKGSNPHVFALGASTCSICGWGRF
jgi:hypothetical protein